MSLRSFSLPRMLFRWRSNNQELIHCRYATAIVRPRRLRVVLPDASIAVQIHFDPVQPLKPGELGGVIARMEKSNRARPEVCELQIAIPPLDEQAEIVSRVDSLLVTVDNLKSVTEEASDRSELAERSLLGKTFMDVGQAVA